MSGERTAAVCDFCGAEPPTRAYDCADFTTAEGSRSVGPWLACGRCRMLIDAGLKRMLAMRSQDKMRERGVAPDATVEELLEVQRGFWINRAPGAGRALEEPATAPVCDQPGCGQRAIGSVPLPDVPGERTQRCWQHMVPLLDRWQATL